MKIYGYENNIFILNELGKRVKDIRVSHSMTQTELAEKAGISYNTVVRFEKGDGTKLENLIKIMRVLGVLQNFDLLIPEQELTPEEIFKGGSKRKRASKTRKEDKSWIWGDEM